MATPSEPPPSSATQELKPSEAVSTAGAARQEKIIGVLSLIIWLVQKATFFLGRVKILLGEKNGMAIWREHLLGFLSRIAHQPANFFKFQPGRVNEPGIQLEI